MNHGSCNTFRQYYAREHISTSQILYNTWYIAPSMHTVEDVIDSYEQHTHDTECMIFICCSQCVICNL